MANRVLVVLGSARKSSETRLFLDKALASVDHALLDLLDFHVSPYTYSDDYPPTDDFLKIVGEILKHETIVFATPVYWYSMSGAMKTLFDRFTDLVTVKKRLGRQLRGKTVLLVAVGADEELPSGFEVPFSLTSSYLGMSYQGHVYYSTKHPKPEKVLEAAIASFAEKATSRPSSLHRIGD